MDLERQERDPREAEAVDPPPPPPRVAKAKETKVKETRIMLDHPIAVTLTTMAQKEKLERTTTPPP